jgi:hypothetical protein
MEFSNGEEYDYDDDTDFNIPKNDPNKKYKYKNIKAALLI